MLHLTASNLVLAGEIRREDADAAMADCQAKRQRLIEPMRQEEIEHCIKQKRGDRDYCERFNRDYG